MLNRDLLDQFKRMEAICFKSFSQGTDKSWGTILYNPDLPERHDANHAEVVNTSGNTSDIIHEISDFYSQKKFDTRINFYDPDEEHPFKKLLAESDFKYIDIDQTTTFMKLERIIGFEELVYEKDTLQVNLTHQLPHDSQIGEDVAFIIHSEWPIQNLVTNENYYYFILYDDKEPVSVLSFYLYEPFMLARMDDVITIKNKRNNGYATFLVKFASNWVQNNDFNPYLLTNNPIAKNVYEKIGYKKLFSCTKIHWVK